MTSQHPESIALPETREPADDSARPDPVEAKPCNVHLILQAKGGVGKSVAASLLAQFLTEREGRGLPLTCIDTDPMNATFSGYKRLEVHRVDIMRGTEINPRRFDDVVELIMKEPRHAIVDNGASSFIALANYLLINEIPSLFAELGRTLVIHILITGGSALLDTLQGFDALATQFGPPTRLVVWLNPYYGPIEVDDRPFDQMSVFQRHKARLAALITLPELQPQTFGKDLSDLLQSRRTFAEVLLNKQEHVILRQRLRIVRGRIFDELRAAAETGVV